ncbi:hypothetical protein [Streptomyces sp. NBC_01320]|uniref:hypothetical protein n=1 Tax=Streptomyces sp. NBC_01320 TaxID=2903824 RepID=UPI002E0F13AC|nr:hypothetical protein OG395_13810 [Streptomyces sp. NBC_01320]
MTRLSERTDRRRDGARASAVLGWLLILLAMVSCCSLAETGAAAHHATVRTATAAATPALTPPPASTARIVVVVAPDDRGVSSSCHGLSEHATPVVLPAQAAPVALPGSAVTAPAGRLAGAAGIRGPSNDAVGAVDHLRLQVQRI